MSFLDYFRSKKTNTASVAKERLQIIVAHERGQGEDYLMAMVLPLETAGPVLRRALAERITVNSNPRNDTRTAVLDMTSHFSNRIPGLANVISLNQRSGGIEQMNPV